jgi:ATP-dependent Lon protease
MRDFRDAKAMAQTLREALKAKSVPLTHSESLELVAKVLGFHDWNVLSARIQSEQQAPVTEAATVPPISADARLPTVPLRDIVLFPTMIVPVLMGREASKRAVERAMAADQRILAVTQRRAVDDNPAPQGLYRVGVTASVIDRTALQDGTIRAVVKGLERAAIVQWSEGQFLTAEVAPVEESRGQGAEAFDLSRAVLEEFRAYRNVASLSAGPYAYLQYIREPSELADAVASFLLVKIDQKQDLLETSDVIARIEKVRALMQADRQAG